MPPKKDAKKGSYKQGTPLKDVLPPTLKQPAREGKPPRVPELTPTSNVVNPYEPQAEFEEWPGDEAALAFDFGLDAQGKLFTDPTEIELPPSFKMKESHMIFWRRPKELVKSGIEDDRVSFSSVLGNDNRFSRQHTMPAGDSMEGRSSIHFDDGTSEDPELHLFSVIEREETQEEVELRIKEMTEKQQQQGKKKGGKKEEPIDPNPQRVKDIKLGSISMKEDIPAYAKWIASQLQIIKDRNIRDANTKKPFWTKIYPQRDGAPVYNPSGRYWVKLYHMGKEKKIEIDDKIPVVYGSSLFPKNEKSTEIWPMIFSKALVKLTSSRWIHKPAKEVEVGDGSIMYALTGYLPETIDLNASFQEKWKSVTEYLSDRKFISGEQYVTCYCLPGFKPSAPSNKAKQRDPEQKSTVVRNSGKKESPRSQSDSRGSIQRGSIEGAGVEQKSPSGAGSGGFKRKEEKSMTSIRSPKPEPVVIQRADDPTRERPTNVLPGFAYSVIDSFENEQFNMVYVLKRGENDLKLRTDYMNLQKVNLNKMTKEEKLDHRKLKKELKEKIFEEDNRRMELIKKPAIHYRLLRVKSAVAKVPTLNFMCPFDQDDVFLAKKCILNKLSKPPNYDSYDLRMDDKSVSSSQVMLESNKILPMDDFSKIENAKEPLKKGSGGSWMTNKDFEGCFQYIQVFHDPTKLKHREVYPLIARQDEEMISYEDREVIVVEGEPEEEEKESSSPIKSFLYSFASTRPNNSIIEPKPSLVLQKYDFQNFEVAYSYKTLNQPHDSDCLTLENKNQVFRIQLLSPLTSVLWISSNLHFRAMSMAEFLCTYQGYQVKSQMVEYPIIEKGRYHLFYKGIINPLNQKETIVYRLKNSTDSAVFRYIRFKLVELTEKSYTSPEEFKTGVVTYPMEQTFYLSKSIPVTLQAGTKYMIIIEGITSETINEGSFELDVLFQNTEFTLEQIEQVEALEYFDKYAPTKYGILFRERIFLNQEVQASFFVRINDFIASANQQTVQKGKKGEAPQFEEKEIQDKKTIKLELLRDDDLIAFSFGQNKVGLSNVTIYPTNNKEEPRNYYLQASFNLREWPEGKEEGEQTQNLHWILKVCTSDTLAIFRDTQKEENIKAIKKSWEDKEPGRLERAKVARKKFIIMEKQRNGEHLEADELQLLNEPRQKKNKEEEVKKDIKGKPPQKAPVKPPAGKPGAKKEEAPVEEKKEERPAPKSENHVMRELCEFLKHMEKPRLIPNDDDSGEPVVRTEEEVRELREKILLGKEEAYGIQERNKEAKDKIKEIITHKRENIVKDLHAMREAMKENMVRLLKEREEFRKRDKESKDKERAIMTLCKQEKPNYEEVTKCINENSEGQIDPDLLRILKMVKKNAYIGEKTDRINAALLTYDPVALTAVLEEIRNEEIEIDPDLTDKAFELLDMAEKNPNFIVEKQKEAQKAAKGKKK